MSDDLIVELLPLLEQAECLANDPETRRRVKLAKLPLIYAKLVQGLPLPVKRYYMSTGTRIRDALLGSNYDKTDYGKLISEIEEITSNEGITRFGGPYKHMPTDIRRWRLMLTMTDHPRLWTKLNDWKFKTDPGDVGLDEKWYSTETDVSEWVNMRSDLGVGWEKQGFPNYTGVAWYRQHFRVSEDVTASDFLFLAFLGVGGEADIYVNGKSAFLHKGPPYTKIDQDDLWASSFGYNIKTWLKPGEENLIAVRVEHEKGVGGIWMPVYLVPSSVPGD